jgi:hypothetical protein
VEAWLDAIPVGGIGVGSALVVVAFMVYRGLLVPRRQVDALTAVMEARLATAEQREATVWQAWQTSEKAREVLSGQVGELLEQGRTMDHFIRSMPRPGGPTQ